MKPIVNSLTIFLDQKLSCEEELDSFIDDLEDEIFGLSSRDFERKFVLSEDMVIKGAALSNGMLYVGLERIIPDHKKPRKIELTSKNKILN